MEFIGQTKSNIQLFTIQSLAQAHQEELETISAPNSE